MSYVSILAALAAAISPLCSAVAAPPRFTDVTRGCGIKVADNTGVGGTNAHAVAVEDFDGDGKLDVIIPTFGAPHVRYFRNLGSLRFADVTRHSGLENFQGDGTGAAAADFDRDGKLDIYLTSLRGGASRLYQGNGDGAFIDISRKAGVLIETPADGYRVEVLFPTTRPPAVRENVQPGQRIEVRESNGS